MGRSRHLWGDVAGPALGHLPGRTTPSTSAGQTRGASLLVNVWIYSGLCGLAGGQLSAFQWY